MIPQYILDENRIPRKCADTHEWARWFGDPRNRTVANDLIGPYWVSTIFLGFDHRCLTGGVPLLFETMTFRNSDSIDQRRCCTWEEAETQHREMCDQARETFQLETQYQAPAHKESKSGR